MKYSIEGLHTCRFGELVEGEAFMRDGAIWIYCGTTIVHDLHYTIEKAHLLMVTNKGLIPSTYDLYDLSIWEVQPLEVTDISFAPSNVSKEARQFM